MEEAVGGRSVQGAILTDPAKGTAASFTSSRIREKGMGTDRDRAWRACRAIKEEASP